MPSPGSPPRCKPAHKLDIAEDLARAIFAATHNLLWAQLSHMLKPAIGLLVETSNHSAAELSDSMERHRRLMEAIRLRQPDEAEQAALSVLERTGLDLGFESLFDHPPPRLAPPPST